MTSFKVNQILLCHNYLCSFKFIKNTIKMLTYPAAARNQDPILNTLKQIIPDSKPLRALEFGSGSGQHIAHFGKHFTNIIWQPSDVDRSLFESINAHIKLNKLNNVLEPLKLDLTAPLSTWPTQINQPQKYDLILCINVIHITPWKCTEGLFNATGILLKPSSLLVMYGPYSVDGVLVPESNIRFDQSLRAQNPEWGVRDTRQLNQLANQNGLTLIKMFDLPAYNKILVFKKI